MIQLVDRAARGNFAGELAGALAQAYVARGRLPDMAHYSNRRLADDAIRAKRLEVAIADNIAWRRDIPATQIQVSYAVASGRVRAEVAFTGPDNRRVLLHSSDWHDGALGALVDLAVSLGALAEVVS